MRYVVQIEVPVEAGNQLERKPGGPGPMIEALLKRFKPEGAYFGTTRRAVYLVVDLATAADIVELMVTCAHNLGAQPTFTPVMTADEFPLLGPVLERVLAAAR